MSKDFDTKTDLEKSPALAESAGGRVRQNVPKEPKTALEELENLKNSIDALRFAFVHEVLVCFTYLYNKLKQIFKRR